MSRKPFWRYMPTNEEYVKERQQINAAKAVYAAAKEEGRHSPRAADALFELCDAYQEHGHFQIAQWLMNRIFPHAEEIYPEDDIRSADMMMWTAFGIEDEQEALAHAAQALARAQQIAGADSVEAGYAMHNLGTLHSNFSRRAEGVRWQLEGIACLRKRLPDGSAELFNMMSWTARRCSMFKEYTAALELYSKLCRVSLRDRGEDDRTTLSAMQGMARAYDGLGWHAQALLLWRACCRIMQEKEGADSRELFSVLDSCCDCCISIGADDEALEIIGRLLEMKERSTHHRHSTLRKAAGIHTRRGDDEAAADCLRAALEYMEDSKNAIFRSKNEFKRELAAVCRRLGREQEAAEVEATITDEADPLTGVPGFPFEMIDDGNGGQRMRVTAMESVWLRNPGWRQADVCHNKEGE